MTHTIEGTWDEIEAQKDSLIGHRLRVIIDPEDDCDYGAPEHLTVRDAAHLERLLQEGLASPKTPMTEADWNDIRQELSRRAQIRSTSSDA